MAIGDELASLEFASMIGGPLNAVIKAQAPAAITSVDFIKSVGFKQNGDLETVKFAYDKAVPRRDANQNRTGEVDIVKHELTVPLLTMLLRRSSASVPASAARPLPRSTDTRKRLRVMRLQADARAHVLRLRWVWGASKPRCAMR